MQTHAALFCVALLALLEFFLIVLRQYLVVQSTAQVAYQSIVLIVINWYLLESHLEVDIDVSKCPSRNKTILSPNCEVLDGVSLAAFSYVMDKKCDMSLFVV